MRYGCYTRDLWYSIDIFVYRRIRKVFHSQIWQNNCWYSRRNSIELGNKMIEVEVCLKSCKKHGYMNQNTWRDVKIQVCSFHVHLKVTLKETFIVLFPARVILCLWRKKNVWNFKYSLHWVSVVFLARREKGLWECSGLLRWRWANFWIPLISVSFSI